MSEMHWTSAFMRVQPMLPPPPATAVRPMPQHPPRYPVRSFTEATATAAEVAAYHAGMQAALRALRPSSFSNAVPLPIRVHPLAVQASPPPPPPPRPSALTLLPVGYVPTPTPAPTPAFAPTPAPMKPLKLHPGGYRGKGERKTRTARRTISTEQQALIEAKYAVNPYPSPSELCQILVEVNRYEPRRTMTQLKKVYDNLRNRTSRGRDVIRSLGLYHGVGRRPQNTIQMTATTTTTTAAAAAATAATAAATAVEETPATASSPTQSPSLLSDTESVLMQSQSDMELEPPPQPPPQSQPQPNSLAVPMEVQVQVLAEGTGDRHNGLIATRGENMTRENPVVAPPRSTVPKWFSDRFFS